MFTVLSKKKHFLIYIEKYFRPLYPKGQENPNFSAFDTLGSETDNPAFDPGRFGTRPDGTEILKLYAKPEVEIVRKLERCTQNHIDARYDEVNEHS